MVSLEWRDREMKQGGRVEANKLTVLHGHDIGHIPGGQGAVEGLMTVE